MSTSTHSLVNLNSNFISNNDDITTFMPGIEYTILSLRGNNSPETYQVDISGNGTTNYCVLVSYWYNYGGSGNTYTPTEQSNALGWTIIYNKNTTHFTIQLNKSGSKNSNCEICLTVLYGVNTSA